MYTLSTAGGGDGAATEQLPRISSVALRIRSLPLLVAVATILTIAVREATDPDLWWHLATGRYIVAQRRIPAFDVFSFTATDHRWVTHEWLSDLLLYGGYRLVGLGGLVVAFAALIALSFVLVYRRCPRRPLVAACSVLLAATASAMTWGVRPQMLSLFLASLYLYILEKVPEEGSPWLWLLPPLTLLWANLHSGFVTGLAIIGVFLVSREASWLVRRGGSGPWMSAGARQLAWVALASLGCSLLTPNGISAALFPFGTLSNRLIQSNVEEWFSPNFHAAWAWPLAVYWLALLLTSAASRRGLRGSQALLLLGAAAASLYSTRHVPFLALVGGPVLAEQAEGLGSGRRMAGQGPSRPPSPRMRVALGIAMAALLVAIGLRVHGVVRRWPEVERTHYPAGALAHLREQGIDGRILNTYHWGGYLIWHGYRVFIDGRAELYGDEVMGQFLKAYAVQTDWEAPLRDYAVDVVLIETDSRLAVVLRESGRWQEVYRDGLATVFVPAGQASQ